MMKKASSVELRMCNNPECGIHMIAYDEDRQPIVEITTTPAQTREMAETFLLFLIGRDLAEVFDSRSEMTKH